MWAIVPQLILDKIAGFVTFHPDTLVVAAGNDPESCSIVREIHNPLLNRLKVIKIKPPTVDGWRNYMMRRFGDKWARETYVFLKRFESEGYLLKLPKEPAGFDNFPSPRTWTWVALDLYHGFNSVDDIVGLLGEEVGLKFYGFMKTNVDIDELIRNPAGWFKLDLDAKYMACLLLGNAISKARGRFNKFFNLIDAMASESREYVVVTCISVSGRKVLINFLRELLKARPKYRDMLMEIVTLAKQL